MANESNRRDLFDDLDHSIGDDVAVLPHVQGGHRQGGNEPVYGAVANVRKDNCVFQYLVDVEDGGRNWYDAKYVVEPDDDRAEADEPESYTATVEMEVEIPSSVVDVPDLTTADDAGDIVKDVLYGAPAFDIPSRLLDDMDVVDVEATEEA